MTYLVILARKPPFFEDKIDSAYVTYSAPKQISLSDQSTCPDVRTRPIIWNTAVQKSGQPWFFVEKPPHNHGLRKKAGTDDQAHIPKIIYDDTYSQLPPSIISSNNFCIAFFRYPVDLYSNLMENSRFHDNQGVWSCLDAIDDEGV